MGKARAFSRICGGFPGVVFVLLRTFFGEAGGAASMTPILSEKMPEKESGGAFRPLMRRSVLCCREP